MVTTNSNVTAAEKACEAIEEMIGVLMPIIKYIDQPIEGSGGRRGINLSTGGYRSFYLCRDGNVWTPSTTEGHSVEKFLANRMYVVENYGADSPKRMVEYLVSVADQLVIALNEAISKLDERRQQLAGRRDRITAYALAATQ